MIHNDLRGWVDTYPDYRKNGYVIEKYIRSQFSVVSVLEGSSLPPAIIHHLKNKLEHTSLFQSSHGPFKLYDRPYVMKRLNINGDINTIHPSIENIVSSVVGEDDPLEAMKIVQKEINRFLSTLHDPTTNRKYEFIFVNQTFYGSGPGTVMGVFAKKGTLQHYNLIERFGLHDTSTKMWFDDNNNSVTVDRYRREQKDSSGGGSFLLECIGFLFEMII